MNNIMLVLRVLNDFDICIHHEMITTVSLVTISPHTKFYDITDLTFCAVYYLPVTYITKGLYLLISFTCFVHPPISLRFWRLCIFSLYL